MNRWCLNIFLNKTVDKVVERKWRRLYFNTEGVYIYMNNAIGKAINLYAPSLVQCASRLMSLSRGTGFPPHASRSVLTYSNRCYTAMQETLTREN
jgi:hypothetical protein